MGLGEFKFSATPESQKRQIAGNRLSQRGRSNSEYKADNHPKCVSASQDFTDKWLNFDSISAPFFTPQSPNQNEVLKLHFDKFLKQVKYEKLNVTWQESVENPQYPQPSSATTKKKTLLTFLCQTGPYMCLCVSIHTATQVGCEDVLGCNEQLLAEVSSLGGAVGQQLKHSLYHLLRVLSHQVLIKRDIHTYTTYDYIDMIIF